MLQSVQTRASSCCFFVVVVFLRFNTDLKSRVCLKGRKSRLCRSKKWKYGTKTIDLTLVLQKKKVKNQHIRGLCDRQVLSYSKVHRTETHIELLSQSLIKNLNIGDFNAFVFKIWWIKKKKYLLLNVPSSLCIPEKQQSTEWSELESREQLFVPSTLSVNPTIPRLRSRECRS